jgi:hypothetical protein
MLAMTGADDVEPDGTGSAGETTGARATGAHAGTGPPVVAPDDLRPDEETITAEEEAEAAATEATLSALSSAWHGGAPVDDAGTTAVPPVGEAVDPHEPRLPGSTESAPPPAEAPPTRSPMATPAPSVYRTPDERNRSVYRRANPWYRRLARGVVAAVIIGGLGVAAYFGARAVQDYLDRDRLPSAGTEIPDIRQSSFLITSTASDVPLQGTLTVDFDTGAYEFVGLAGSPNATDNLTSPDGQQVYAQNAAGRWEPLDPNAPVVTTIQHAIDLLSDDGSADAILTNRLRRGYVDLVREVDEGEDDNQLTRYDLELRLAGFADAFPLQWQDFQRDAIPGIADDNRHSTSIWLDDENVLVRVQDPATGWNWERVAYSSTGFSAFDPPAGQIQIEAAPAETTAVECTIDELGLGWTTALPSCDDANTLGRQLAVQVGLADVTDGPAAELAFASVCQVLQGTETRTYDDEQYINLAGLLVDAGVCPGNTALLQPAG